MDFQQHTAMLAALAAGTATPDQQREASAHIAALKKRHADELREADREAHDAYHEGQAEAAERAEVDRYY